MHRYDRTQRRCDCAGCVCMGASFFTAVACLALLGTVAEKYNSVAFAVLCIFIAYSGLLCLYLTYLVVSDSIANYMGNNQVEHVEDEHPVEPEVLGQPGDGLNEEILTAQC